ncbi:hypothetical protein V6N11_056814 [Hibiscus sabdariffa]|uniref:Protein kinase domain-containing protein n=1 Tax=Hibiscus sabdariffa TaxID=183260 RepID=A0ABR2T5J2_9ROSI
MTTRVQGTLGYLAPEYAMWGKVSESCDVYSFGILLLELVTGRKPIEKLPGGVKRTISEWAEPFITEGRFKELNEPEKRPNMKEVAGMLKGYASRGNLMKPRMDSVK